MILKNQDKIEKILKIVQNLLGFYTLALMTIEGLTAYLVTVTSENERLIVIVLGLGVFLFIVMVVTSISLYDVDILYNESKEK